MKDYCSYFHDFLWFVEIRGCSMMNREWLLWKYF